MEGLSGIDLYDPKLIGLGVGCLFVVYLIVKAVIDAGVDKQMNMPKVKGRWPVLGNAIDMIQNPPWEIMDKWTSEYGPLYRMNVFGRECIVVADPDLLKVSYFFSVFSFRACFVHALFYCPFFRSWSFKPSFLSSRRTWTSPTGFI